MSDMARVECLSDDGIAMLERYFERNNDKHDFEDAAVRRAVLRVLSALPPGRALKAKHVMAKLVDEGRVKPTEGTLLRALGALVSKRKLVVTNKPGKTGRPALEDKQYALRPRVRPVQFLDEAPGSVRLKSITPEFEETVMDLIERDGQTWAMAVREVKHCTASHAWHVLSKMERDGKLRSERVVVDNRMRRMFYAANGPDDGKGAHREAGDVPG